MEYSEMKKNKILLHATAWMKVKTIALSERSQTQEPVYVCVYI